MRSAAQSLLVLMTVPLLLTPAAADMPRAVSWPARGADASAAIGGAELPAAAVDAEVQAAAVQARADTATLRRSLERIVREHAGIAGVSVRDLRTGVGVSVRGNETFPSASLIKVAVLVALLDEVAEGRMALEERSTLVARDRVGGSGVLGFMSSGTTLTLEDLARLMITISDNTATNLVLDKLDVRTVGAKMEALGLPHSKIHSKTFRRETSISPDSSALYGLGVTTPDETVELFARLHAGQAVSPALDSLALAILGDNQDNTMLTRSLPGGTVTAHKSGMVARARNDCGILYTPASPVAVCVMTRENEDASYGVDNAAHLLIARVGRAVYDHFNPPSRVRGGAAWEGRP